jgi:hypothetical protein
VDLVRDVLDQLVVDRNGRVMGRVDGILLEQDANRPPRVTDILLGPAVLAERVHPALGRVVRRIEGWLGLDAGRPVRIPVDAIDRIDTRVHLRVPIGETAAGDTERRLRRWFPQPRGTR